MDLIPGLNATAGALEAEKVRMEMIAQNIANSMTTRDESGNPYQRKLVSFEAFLDGSRGRDKSTMMAQGVRVAGIINDPTPGQKIYNPTHPHADEQGMVEMPNVQVTREMVDMITSSRAYEANLKVISTSRQMAQQTMRIGR